MMVSTSRPKTFLTSSFWIGFSHAKRAARTQVSFASMLGLFCLHYRSLLTLTSRAARTQGLPQVVPYQIPTISWCGSPRTAGVWVCVCVRACVRAYVCVCACVLCTYIHIYIYRNVTYTHTHTHTYTHPHPHTHTPTPTPTPTHPHPHPHIHTHTHHTTHTHTLSMHSFDL